MNEFMQLFFAKKGEKRTIIVAEAIDSASYDKSPTTRVAGIDRAL